MGAICCEIIHMISKSEQVHNTSVISKHRYNSQICQAMAFFFHFLSLPEKPMRFSAKDVPILSKTMLRKPKGCLPLLPHPYSLVGPLTLKCKRRVYLKGKFFEKDKIIGKFYGDSCITVFFMTTCQLFDGCYWFFLRCLNPFFLVKESQSWVFIESLMLM